MNLKKILLAGIVTGILFVFLDMLIAIITVPIFAPYADLQIWKTPPDIVAGAAFDLINGLILAGVYAVIYCGLPGTGWRKGLNYGIIVGLFRVAMTAFSTIVMYSIPISLVATSFISGYFEIIALCIVLSVLFEKF